MSSRSGCDTQRSVHAATPDRVAGKARDAARGDCVPRETGLVRRRLAASSVIIRRVLSRPVRSSALIALLCVLCVTAVMQVAHAQQQRITGDRLSGFVLPIEPLQGDVTIDALRAWSWDVDDTQRLYLEGDVRISIVNQTFTADAATAWINRIPSEGGVINQIAVYFSEVRNPALQPGKGVAGRDLLVTGSARGEVSLNVALLMPEHQLNGLIHRGEQRLAQHLARLMTQPLPPLETRPQVEAPPSPQRDQFIPVPGQEYVPAPHPDEAAAQRAGEAGPWLAAPQGVVRFAAAEIDIVTGEQPHGENVITLIGPITVEHLAPPQSEAGAVTRLTLTADRGVLFTDPVPIEELAAGRAGADIVRGIYLEGNVIARAGTTAFSADDYVVRSPKIYYDFRNDRAVMVDAVLRTYSRELDRLIYARASELRQVAQNQWTGKRVRVTTSEFHTPHVAIGAQRMTITRREPPPGEPTALSDIHLDARNITLRAYEFPFFYWPRYSNTLGGFPLRGASIGTRDNDGVRILTSWDLYALLGTEAPEGIDAILKVDGFTKRGFGLGTEVAYELPVGTGLLDLYGIHDDGIDRTAAGEDVDADRTLRGLALWEHHVRFQSDWLFQSQLSWMSDETFISAWRREDYETRREYETSIYLKHQRNNVALTLLGQYELNDFVSNAYLLTSRGYQVDRMPEMTYRRYADSFFDGHLSWSSEARLGRTRLVMHDRTPMETGVPPEVFGMGVLPGDNVRAFFRMMGLPGHHVLRADTRHELAAPFNMGALRVTPFGVGRLTAYDDDFDTFSSDAESVRYFGALGMTVSTEIQRINNAVESRMFDLHRVRHIVEPSATIWWSHSNASRGDYPIYDEDVEAIGAGGALRLGVRNTWQTQRGGPGEWRSVDFLTVDFGAILTSDDTERLYPTPQFFDFRPEYSQFGDHLTGSLIWLPSDTLAITSSGIWDLDESEFVRSSVGMELRHSPVLVTFVEYRRINYPDAMVEDAGIELLDVGWSYQMTPKYRVMISPQWDFHEDEFRSLNLRIARAFPDFELIVLFRYDAITDEASLGATVGLVRF